MVAESTYERVCEEDDDAGADESGLDWRPNAAGHDTGDANSDVGDGRDQYEVMDQVCFRDEEGPGRAFPRTGRRSDGEHLDGYLAVAEIRRGTPVEMGPAIAAMTATASPAAKAGSDRVRDCAFECASLCRDLRTRDENPPQSAALWKCGALTMFVRSVKRCVEGRVGVVRRVSNRWSGKRPV